MTDYEKALYSKPSIDLIQQFLDYQDSIQKDPTGAYNYLLKSQLSHYYKLLQNEKIDTALFINLLEIPKDSQAQDSMKQVNPKNELLFDTAKDLILKHYNQYDGITDIPAIQNFRKLFYQSIQCTYTPQINLKFLTSNIPLKQSVGNVKDANSVFDINSYLDNIINLFLLYDPNSSYFLFKSWVQVSVDDAWKYDNHLFFKVHCALAGVLHYYPHKLKLSIDTAKLIPQIERNDAESLDYLNRPPFVTFLFYVDIKNPSQIQICNITEGTVMDITEIIPKRLLKCLKPSNKAYLSIAAMENYSFLDMDSPPENITYHIDGQFSNGIHAEFDYFFKDGLLPYSFGIGTGVGYSAYSCVLGIDNYQTRLNLDSEFFTRVVNGQNIHEKTTIQSLEIPVNIKFKYKFNNSRFNLIFNVGAVYSLLMESSFELVDQGEITYTGENTVFYPELNTTVTYDLQDVPEYGLLTTTDLNIIDPGNAIAKNYFSGYLSLTGQWALSEKLYAFIGFQYLYGMIINDKEPGIPYVLSKKDGQINNILYYSNKLNLNSTGMQLGVSFNLW